MKTYIQSEKLWKGKDRFPFFHPKISIGHVLLDSMRKCPEKIAQVNNNFISRVSKQSSLWAAPIH